MWKDRHEEVNNGLKCERKSKRKTQKEHYNDQRVLVVKLLTLLCGTDPFVQVCLIAHLHIVPNTIKN
jgi:hypothetical protein